MSRLLKHLILILLACNSFTCYATPLKRVSDVSGCGLMSDNSAINRLLTKEIDYSPSTVFKYVYLSDVINDNCIDSNGNVIDSILYKTLKIHFDSILDFTQKQRYVLRIFPSFNGSGPINGAKMISNVKTDDGKLYVWYPPKLYNITKSKKYPPSTIKWNWSEKFKHTKNISVIDYRNQIFFHMYEKVLWTFSEYLKETVSAHSLNSSTIQIEKCKKGDFVSRIEIGVIGPWGEGYTHYNRESSTDLIKVIELYKKYLYDYWLIAPSFGMTKKSIKNTELYDFQYYLMTTTYGNEKANILGHYKGVKEFGLYIDHLGNLDCDEDFNLINKKGIDELRPLSKTKYKKAPVIGENNGNIVKESNRIDNDFNKFGISMLRIWGDVSKVQDSTITKWHQALQNLGFTICCDFDDLKLRNSELRIKGYFRNEANTPCYDHYWLPQIVIRNNQDGIIYNVIDVPIELSSLDDNNKELDYSIDLKTIPDGSYVVCFRVVDKYHICENLIFDDFKEYAPREYIIGSFDK